MATIRINSRKNKWMLSLDKFKGGTSTIIDEARISPEQAKETVNLIQVQDGLWKPRWGTTYYGLEITGESSIIGASEYITSAGVRELIVIGGTTGKAYKSTNGGTWSEITGATFNTSALHYFLQINNRLYITNGVNPLTLYDGSALTRYSSISAPTGLGLARGSALSAGSYTFFYTVTALNSVGETLGATEQSITTNKDRILWSLANEHIDITWNTVAGATQYQIYISTESGKQVLLAYSATNSYRDNNYATPNPFVLVPDVNTTQAPSFTQMDMSGNRIWATRDPSNRYRVYMSGVSAYIGYFSAYFGGAWVDLEKGGRETPVWVGHYRTGKGDSAATVLCSTPEGVGSIWQISLEQQTVGNTSFVVPIPTKIVGTIGADSSRMAVKVGDELMFGNKRGVFKLGTKENITNVLATQEISEHIRPSYRSLNFAKSSQFCGYWYDAKVFFSATEGTGENDLIFIYDTERKNWNWKWTIGVRQFLEYTDASGLTHFLIVPTSGGRMVECGLNIANDLGQAFKTSYISGLYPIDGDKKVFAKVQDAILELGRPKGEIKFEVLGLEKKRGFASLATKTIGDTVSTINFVSSLFSNYLFGYEPNVPRTFAKATIKKRLRVRRLVNAVQFHVYSDKADTDYTILSIQLDGRKIPVRVPSIWN